MRTVKLILKKDHKLNQARQTHNKTRNNNEKLKI